MLLAIITDIHYGVRQDNSTFLLNNKKFFDEIFFPYLEKNKINTVICLGDLVERRKYISFLTAYYLRESFLEPMKKKNIDFHWIVGNHDLFYREVTDVCAAKELKHGFPIYDVATEITFGGTPILFVPWICKQNKEQIINKIKETRAQIVFGHLELKGFEANKGWIKDDGESPDLFQKFDIVYSGHYHHPSKKGNIQYLGAASQQDWLDWSDERGFHVFDTRTRKLEFIPNPFIMFEKVYYDDSPSGSLDINNLDFSGLHDKFIKVIISSKNDPVKFDFFMDKLEEAHPAEINLVEDHLNVNLTDDESIVSESKDTLSIIREFIQQSKDIVNVEKLDNLIVDLYQEAEKE